jgi:Tol biopolymer transport system component
VYGATAPIPDEDLRIVTPDEEYADMPAWEADSRWVAFRAGRDPDGSIAVMDMQSGEVRRIMPQLPGMQLVWSSDGTRLAFAMLDQAPDYQQDVYVINRDGSILNVSDSPANDFGPAWAPPNQRPE